MSTYARNRPSSSAGVARAEQADVTVWYARGSVAVWIDAGGRDPLQQREGHAAGGGAQAPRHVRSAQTIQTTHARPRNTRSQTGCGPFQTTRPAMLTCRPIRTTHESCVGARPKCAQGAEAQGRRHHSSGPGPTPEASMTARAKSSYEQLHSEPTRRAHRRVRPREILLPGALPPSPQAIGRRTRGQVGAANKWGPRAYLRIDSGLRIASVLKPHNETARILRSTADNQQHATLTGAATGRTGTFYTPSWHTRRCRLKSP